MLNLETRLVVKREIGEDLLTTVRDLATGDAIHSIMELIANSYDADATLVNILYDEQRGTLEIRDNGTGMTPEDLKSFYRSGDSKKRKNPLTPKGRDVIGKFGIATILLSHLADKYTLVTVKDGIRTAIHEEFKGRKRIGESVEGKSEQVAGDYHGTTLKLENLRSDKLDVKQLIKSIQGDLPLHLPDFEVHFNGEKIEPRRFE